MIFTAYQATRSWGDVMTLMALTLLGLYMKRFDWSRPALIVGFVLSPGLEASLYQTAQVYGLSFLLRPQSMLIAVLILARSEEHTSELQSLMRISYAVFCLKKKTNEIKNNINCNTEQT